jgi:hypothetical protein
MGLGYRSVVESLPSMYKALSSFSCNNDSANNSNNDDNLRYMGLNNFK